MMVGRRSFPIGKVSFRGRTVKLRENSLFTFAPKIFSNFPKWKRINGDFLCLNGRFHQLPPKIGSVLQTMMSVIIKKNLRMQERKLFFFESPSYPTQTKSCMIATALMQRAAGLSLWRVLSPTTCNSTLWAMYWIFTECSGCNLPKWWGWLCPSRFIVPENIGGPKTHRPAHAVHPGSCRPPRVYDVYDLGLPLTQDASHHHDDFRIGNP